MEVSERRKFNVNRFYGGTVSDLLICPECGARRFFVENTWYLTNGIKRRLRKCAACGYARNETVPEPPLPIPDGEN